MRNCSVVSARRCLKHDGSSPLFGIWCRSVDSSAVELVVGSVGVGLHVRKLRIIRLSSLLLAQLNKPQFIAGLITDVHRLAELTLGCETPKRKSVNCDRDGLNGDFNDSANKNPVLLYVSTCYNPISVLEDDKENLPVDGRLVCN